MIFQIYINKTLQKLLNIFCIIYLDDIFVFSKNKAQYMKHLQLVMNKFWKYKFYVKLIKYKFFITKMKFLKFIVNMNEISMNLSQINIIVNWSEFKIFQKIQIFFSFTNFYQQFIHNYFCVIELFINLLKKSKTDKKKSNSSYLWRRFEKHLQSLRRFLKQHFCSCILTFKKRHKLKQMFQKLLQKQFSCNEFQMRNF